MKAQFVNFIIKRKYSFLGFLLLQSLCSWAFSFFNLENDFIAVIVFYVIPAVVYALAWGIIEKRLVKNK